MPSISLRAFAKINLSLHVKESRPDGFHEVQTILQAIDLCDRVVCATRRGPFEIRTAAPGVPIDRTNLVWKAAQLLWRAAGRRGEPRDTVVTLQKRIPTQAGLGGGSSDAASALIGLRQVWKAPVPDGELVAAAAEIGSDVPFFLVGGTALALGRGEEVYPLASLPRHWVVLAVPSFGVATRDAYAWLDDARQEGVRPRSLRKRGLTPFLYVPLSNDLEAPVIARHPLIGRIKRGLVREGAVMAAMSGSGSTVFGVFETERAAKRAARSLRADSQNSRSLNKIAQVIVARFLARRAL